MRGTVLILGAKSGIARAVAHDFAKLGFDLILSGRDALDLEPDASDYAIRHKVKTFTAAFDATNYASHQAFYDQLPAKPDVVVCMVGYLPDQKEAESDSALAIRAMETNYVGCAHILNIVANDMEARKSGSIIGVSSVAGDRGRAKNYFYGSAKAGFTAFLSGLRNRLTLSKSGVQVLTVLPGFVYTAMTEGMDLPPKLTATPEQVSKDIIRAWRKKKDVIYTKSLWRWVMRIIRTIPEGMFKKRNI